ncbi:MAG: tripartite tricarboxylate transporter substrate-binding protein, partial [Planctomycetales bacterium]
LQELMTGDLDLVCCSLPEAKSLLVSGDVRCLGVMADDRQASDDFKDYPTLKEQGSDWTLTGWRGIGIAKDTPPEIQDKLVAVLKRIVSGEARVNGESFPEFMDRQGFDHTSRPTTEFAEFLKRNDEMFGTILNRPEFQSVQSGPVGPNVFPAIAGGMFGLSLITILVGSRRRPVVATGASAPKTSVQSMIASESSASPRALLLSGCVVAAVVFHMLAADVLGFVATSAIILFVTTKLLGARVLTSAVVAIVASVGIYQLFSGLLRVPLPIGFF